MTQVQKYKLANVYFSYNYTAHNISKKSIRVNYHLCVFEFNLFITNTSLNSVDGKLTYDQI
jgi:hypothetical protein